MLDKKTLKDKKMKDISLGKCPGCGTDNWEAGDTESETLDGNALYLYCQECCDHIPLPKKGAVIDPPTNKEMVEEAIRDYKAGRSKKLSEHAEEVRNRTKDVPPDSPLFSGCPECGADNWSDADINDPDSDSDLYVVCNCCHAYIPKELLELADKDEVEFIKDELYEYKKQVSQLLRAIDEVISKHSQGCIGLAPGDSIAINNLDEARQPFFPPTPIY